ncbi:receptor-type tyrosine-protein phosphatase epsilon-like [Diadema antillarum]|uniref:receptor-type tyrosine-protein phosphatase epsilon-like n=1 Tax=Diadema antillarum TaxID=105358 RepID=UPI003A8BDA27
MSTEMPTSMSSAKSTSDNGPPQPNGGVTFLSIACVLLVVVVTGLALYWWIRKRKRQRQRRQPGRPAPQSLPEVRYRRDGSDSVNGEVVNVDVAIESAEILLSSPKQSPVTDYGLVKEEERQEKIEEDYQYGGDTINDDELMLENSDGDLENMTPPPIPVAVFVEHVKEMKKDSNSFEDEWSNLSDNSHKTQRCAKIEANVKKNRYKNILPYDHSRVVLELIDGIPNSDYINANHIPGFSQGCSYIASQGPNVASASDFWRMVWQEKIDTIVMVTNLVEKGKTKCEQYWPGCESSVVYDTITVFCDGENHGVYDVRRAFTIEKRGEFRRVDHFHFVKWPDKGVPRNASVVLKFIEQVKLSREGKTTPLLVHCMLGVGRTGVVVTLHNEMERADLTGVVDIFNYVRQMRQCRPQMVQTPEQYEFIHDAILEYILNPNTMIPVDQMAETYRRLLKKDKSTGEIPLEQEYQILYTLCHEPPSNAVQTGGLAENTTKNRYQNVIPVDKHRPLLMTTSYDSSTQYINATFCQAYRERERIITTQMTLPSTVVDFLSLIYDYRISTIVMLNDVMDEQSASIYWDKSNPNITDPFSIDVLGKVESDHWVERTLELKRRRDTRIVQQFQFTSWVAVQSDGFCQNILDFLHHVTTNHDDDDSPILVHCLNGIGRTGVFCVIKMSIDQLEAEGVVDIFQIVKTLRNDNQQMIQSFDDYLLCYSIMNHHITCNKDRVDGSYNRTSLDMVSNISEGDELIDDENIFYAQIDDDDDEEEEGGVEDVEERGDEGNDGQHETYRDDNDDEEEVDDAKYDEERGDEGSDRFNENYRDDVDTEMRDDKQYDGDQTEVANDDFDKCIGSDDKADILTYF